MGRFERKLESRERQVPHRAIWDILVKHCGAPDYVEARQYSFEYHWPECREFRFGGDIGSGAKIWASGDRWYVSIYTEMYSPEQLAERRERIARANTELAALRTAWEAEQHVT